MAPSGEGAGPDRTPRGSKVRRKAPYDKAQAGNRTPSKQGQASQQEQREAGAKAPSGTISRSISSYLFSFVPTPFRRAWQPKANEEEASAEPAPGASTSNAIELASSSDDEDGGTIAANSPVRQPTPTSSASKAAPIINGFARPRASARLASSQSVPSFRAPPFVASTPSQAGDGVAVPGSANERLARFFAEKGDRPLTEVEAKGVFALMQEGQGHGSPLNTPSAFTPIFESPSRPDRQSFYRPSSHLSSLPHSASTGSLPSSTSTTGAAPRRRAIYLGPGRTSNAANVSAARRKRILGTGRAASAPTSAAGGDYVLASRLGRDPEEADPAGPSAGAPQTPKRRRTEGEDDDAPPTIEESEIGLGRFATSSSLPRAHASTSSSASLLTSSKSAPALPTFPTPEIQKQAKSGIPLSRTTATKGKGRLGQVAASATPARPSPLRNVTQAATPSPPSKTSTSLANGPSTPRTNGPGPGSVAGGASPAASVMLSIIRESASKPKAPAAPEIGSPYATRTSARLAANKGGKVGEGAAGTPSKRAALLAAASGSPRTAKSKRKAAEDEGKKELTMQELAERTMPLEYRPRDEHDRPIRVVRGAKAAPAPAPTTSTSTKQPDKAPARAVVAEPPAPTAAESEASIAPAFPNPTSVSTIDFATKKPSAPFVFGKGGDGAPGAGSQQNVPVFSFGADATPPQEKGYGATPEETEAPWQPRGDVAEDEYRLPPPSERLPRDPVPEEPATGSSVSVNGTKPRSARSTAPTPDSAIPTPATEEEGKAAALRLDVADLPSYNLDAAPANRKSTASAGARPKEEDDVALKGFQELVAALAHGELPTFVLI